VIAIQIVLIVFGLLFLLRAFHLILALSWYNNPQPPGSTVTVNGKRVYYRLAGEGQPVVVVIPALASPSVEWWKVQEEVSKTTQVLTYDRAGYGWSDMASRARTSGNVALELSTLLTSLGIESPVILVCHSHGALYAHHFARLFPKSVAGVVFVDPRSPHSDRFKRELDPMIYKKSGMDTTKGIRLFCLLSWTGILRPLKPMVTKGRPFIYYGRGVSTETKELAWKSLLLPKLYKTALQEYRLTGRAAAGDPLEDAGPFPEIPIKVLYHSSEAVVDEIVKYGGLKVEDASKVEKLWEELVKEYLKLSPRSEWIVAAGSNHFVHLQAHDLVVNTVLDLVRGTRQSPSP